MKRKTKIVLAAVAAAVLAWGGLHLFRFLRVNMTPTAGQELLYLRERTTVDSLVSALQRQGRVASPMMMKTHARLLKIKTVPAGCYRLVPEGDYRMLRRLASGRQEPVNVTISSLRTPEALAGRLAVQLLADSAAWMSAFTDTALLAAQGVTPPTLLALFMPDTYEVYWTVSPAQLLKRMKGEFDRFWTTDRQAKAKRQGLTPLEAVTLASIVGGETRNTGEMPRVAGLYLNRLRKHMLLQSDPTVIFALGDFSIRRVRAEHLRVNSPYNTYLHTGLPPGPIRMVTPVLIDAVLNAEQHNYLYMCAKETFDGTHNFAVTYAQHLQNARRYQQALNRRGIK